LENAALENKTKFQFVATKIHNMLSNKNISHLSTIFVENTRAMALRMKGVNGEKK